MNGIPLETLFAALVETLSGTRGNPTLSRTRVHIELETLRYQVPGYIFAFNVSTPTTQIYTSHNTNVFATLMSVLYIIYGMRLVLKKILRTFYEKFRGNIF